MAPMKLEPADMSQQVNPLPLKPFLHWHLSLPLQMAFPLHLEALQVHFDPSILKLL
jgi:hypothetical protein